MSKFLQCVCVSLALACTLPAVAQAHTGTITASLGSCTEGKGRVPVTFRGDFESFPRGGADRHTARPRAQWRVECGRPHLQRTSGECEFHHLYRWCGCVHTGGLLQLDCRQRWPDADDQRQDGFVLGPNSHADTESDTNTAGSDTNSNAAGAYPHPTTPPAPTPTPTPPPSPPPTPKVKVHGLVPQR